MKNLLLISMLMLAAISMAVLSGCGGGGSGSSTTPSTGKISFSFTRPTNKSMGTREIPWGTNSLSVTVTQVNADGTTYSGSGTAYTATGFMNNTNHQQGTGEIDFSAVPSGYYSASASAWMKDCTTSSGSVVFGTPALATASSPTTTPTYVAPNGTGYITITMLGVVVSLENVAFSTYSKATELGSSPTYVYIGALDAASDTLLSVPAVNYTITLTTGNNLWAGGTVIGSSTFSSSGVTSHTGTVYLTYVGVCPATLPNGHPGAHPGTLEFTVNTTLSGTGTPKLPQTFYVNAVESSSLLTTYSPNTVTLGV